MTFPRRVLRVPGRVPDTAGAWDLMQAVPLPCWKRNATTVTSSHTGAPPNTTKALTSALSQVLRTHAVSTSTPTAARGFTTQGASPNTTSATHVSHSASQTPSTASTAHNRSATSVPSPVTITATINSKENPGSKFDIGSFLGGIVLTLGVLSILYFGCKTYYSRRGIRYRTIDEHDAII
ncbi:porimin isoform X2 [Prionailurus bengalensis]|uniref:porimin isoform X2 n=1 Tax=Prionailurus bengalensis TaxID=37029 RepID=UPI001CA80723|nr:porimin isoform X2 [Prionailurus bengalensis]